MVEIKHAELNNSSHTFFFWICKILSPLSWYWSGKTSDLHFEANECSPLLTPSFHEVAQYWLKTMWTCRQLLEKRGELTMLKYFCKNSPKVSAPEDFVNCRTAMPLITTTCGFVNAVSCWTTWMSFYRREHSVLLTPFLRLPLVSEYGIEDMSKLSTSFRQIGWDEELDKQVLVGINSN